MGDFVRIFDSLNPLKMFTGSSVLGVSKTLNPFVVVFTFFY